MAAHLEGGQAEVNVGARIRRAKRTTKNGMVNSTGDRCWCVGTSRMASAITSVAGGTLVGSGSDTRKSQVMMVRAGEGVWVRG